MRRQPAAPIAVWAALLLMFGLPVQAAPDYRLEPRQIAPDTWLVEGRTENFSKDNGGDIVNVAFLATDAGVLVIDTGPSRRYGEALRAAIGRVTDAPVRRVLLTHHHPDHVLGNQAFADVPIAALAGTARLMAEEGDAMAENMYRLVGDWMRGTEVVLPDETLEPGVLAFGGHRLRLLALQGHTGADLAILDETTGVLFAGDLVFHDRALTTPHTPGIDAWLADLDRLGVLAWSLVVPGHGPIARDDGPLRQTADYLRWLDRTFTEAAARGADMNEVMQSPIPTRFADLPLAGYELIRSTNHLYPRYEAAQFHLLAPAP